MEQRTERIVVQTPHHRIIGDLALPRDGHRSRLSDFLGSGALAFISLTDVVIGDEGEEGHRLEFAAVAVGHILFAHPHEAASQS